MTLSPSTDDSPRPIDASPATFREVRYEVSRDFVPILAQAGISLLVSTYQAGKLVVVGAGRGELTLAFHNFEQAMGVALSPATPGMLAIGTRNQVWLLAREAGMASQLPGESAHDDCYLARRSHFTGQIHIHELAWGFSEVRDQKSGVKRETAATQHVHDSLTSDLRPPTSEPELWLVNTLFSCLATLDDRHSFVPRWRPRFITGLAAQDRCHLNGLAMEGGRPKYVTAMSETDGPQSWRPTKIHSGCVIDVASGETIARGLAMPHSPRLAGGRLWVLNSGLGDISYVEPDSGQIVSVEQVPGYTRGLAFHGPLAFVGMSRIRETSTFGGVPIAERRDELRCGVAVIDMRQGKAVAYIEFKSGVEEIFAVEVVPNARCPFISGPSPTDDDTSAVWMVPHSRFLATGAALPLPLGEGGLGHRREALVGKPSEGLQVFHGQHQSNTLTPSLSQRERGPNTAEQWNDHGGRLMEQHEYDAAEAAFRKAIELKPTLGAAWANLAFLTADRGQTEEGRRLYGVAHSHQPSPQLRLVEATVLPPIFQDQRHIESAREKFSSEVEKLVADKVTIDPTRTTTPTYFFLAYQGENDRDLMAQLARVTPSPRSQPIEPRPRANGERIRLGMLSHFFCNHTIGQLNVGLIEQLDRRRFELVILASGGADDALARRIRASADRYVSIPADIRTALALVAGQELDILHFPDLGMSPFTFTLAHSRLAPVQTVTWGHPVTTGLPTIDHFISCEHGETDEGEAHYTERLVRLSRLNTCLERPRRSGAPRERAYFGLGDSDHVYACPQSAFKFHPEFDEVLAGILRSDPAGVVPIIEPKYPQWQKLLEDRWRKSMPDVADRLRFVRRIPRTDFLELLACSDVMLDPFPFGGGHSSYEALSLGLPVITLAGRFLRGRLTYAMYQQMGYLDHIAQDKSDYIRLALALGTSKSLRSTARAAILDRCAPLYDDRSIVRELEDFWERSVAGY